jgi:hypothetical protein
MDIGGNESDRSHKLSVNKFTSILLDVNELSLLMDIQSFAVCEYINHFT